eukprot:12066509-Alexandrium_andersonii.AAC.1
MAPLESVLVRAVHHTDRGHHAGGVRPAPAAGQRGSTGAAAGPSYPGGGAPGCPALLGLRGRGPWL